MLGQKRCSGIGGSPAEGLETRAAGFPAHQIGEDPWRRAESGNISGYVEWLNQILRIVPVFSITPAADFDVHLAVVLVASPLVPRSHAENSGRRQVRSFPHRH